MGEDCSMKGFLSFMILRLISKGNISGEEIRQEIKKRRGSRPSPGTIYPVLKSLKNLGLIKEVKGNGKTKKYGLTKKGRKELERVTVRFCQIFYDMKNDFQRCCR